MNYHYGKWASGVAYRYARGVSREYQCPQCHAAWLDSALTVCFDCRRKNIDKDHPPAPSPVVGILVRT
jgi:hypothetical protein